MGDAIVVVGAGLAGWSAVRALRAGGFDGPLALIGAESHPPYDRPPLSKGFLAGGLTAIDLALSVPGDIELGVDQRLAHRAVALHPGERTVELDTGERIGGRGVVIATGARARALPGRMPAGVHTLRTLDDALALREELRAGARLAVIGAGFVGAEVAATARGLGVDVTLVEAAPAPLAAALGPQVGRMVAGLHADHGVRLVTGTAVAGLAAGGHGRVDAVTLADARRLQADVVVVGIGSVPDVEWLVGCGLDIADGVLTDADGATGAPGVVAVGDCTRRFEPTAGAIVRQEHWTNALHHPARAAAALLGAAPPVQPAVGRLPYVWSDLYDLRLQVAGHYRPGDTLEVVEGSLTERSFVAVYRRGGVEVGVVAANSPRGFGLRRKALAATRAS